jgi:hypothetical protein
MVYAATEEEQYQSDNKFYGTTPFIELKDMPDLYVCMPPHPAFESPEFANDMVRFLWGKQQRQDSLRIAITIADAEWDSLQKVYANWKDAF